MKAEMSNTATHFRNDKSRDYTVNFVRAAWLSTPANLRTQFPPTLDDVEGFISEAIKEWPELAYAGRPVALLAERGYQISVAVSCPRLRRINTTASYERME